MNLCYKEEDLDMLPEELPFVLGPESNKDDISTALAYMVSNDFNVALKALTYVIEYLKTNYVENFTSDHVTYLIGNIKNRDLVGREDITPELVEQSNIKAKISREILVEILKQPELCHFFVSDIFDPQSGYEYLLDDLPSNWAIECFTTIASQSQNKRDKCFEYGFYSSLQEMIHHDPSVDIIELQLSNAIGSLVKFPFSDCEIQSGMAKLFFGFLYDKLIGDEDSQADPNFLKSALKLLYHDQYNYPEEYQIHRFFSLCNEINENRSMIQFIRKFVDVRADRKQSDFFERSVKYIKEYLIRFGSQLNCDLTQIFEGLFFIIQETTFAKASLLASEALIHLVHLRFDIFMGNHYLGLLIQLLNKDFTQKIKLNLTIVLFDLFALACHEQMTALVNEPCVSILFDNIFMIDFSTIEMYPCVIKGLYNFVDFCGTSTDYLEPYNIYIRCNDDLESWVSETQSSSICKERQEEIELLLNLISKRNAEYDGLSK